MPRGTFDCEEFYAALEAERAARAFTWKQVAREAGVSASTLTRMAQGKRPDVNTLAALASWSGLRTDDYVVHPGGKPATQDALTQISAYLRADASLSPRAAEAIEKVLRATYNLFKEETPDAESSTPEGLQKRS